VSGLRIFPCSDPFLGTEPFMVYVKLFNLLLSLFLQGTDGKGFLHDDHSSFSAQMLDRDLQTAMQEVMGCGSRKVSDEALQRIRKEVEPMWKTMPLNPHGNLEWRSLRYIAHRYFMKRSSMLIRGFEPSLALNESEKGAAEILSKQVPGHVDSMLGGEHKIKGYDLDDGVSLLSALEQLVFDSESHLLEAVYAHTRADVNNRLGRRSFRQLLENYIVYWMLGDDLESINILMRNRTLLEIGFPHWADLQAFIDGRIELLNWQRSQVPKVGHGKTLMEGHYTFDEAHIVVGGITETFQDYWQSECTTMKNQLVDMDKTGTGRVRLSDFYGTGMEADWRFGESESYLRELGVLDDTSPWLGKQVIIPNYLQAASNCIVSTPHYLICCHNQCESILGEVEDAVGSSVADPERILAVVGQISSSSMDLPQLTGSLTEQLHKVAQSNNGLVPLHGRLFAQWLHYAFPRECAFPHKVGTFSKAQTMTPEKFGETFIASQEEMEAEVSQAVAINDTDIAENHQWMSQWSLEEELFADYAHMSAPWERTRRSIYGVIGFVVVVALVTLGVVAPRKSVSSSSRFVTDKPHMV